MEKNRDDREKEGEIKRERDRDNNNNNLYINTIRAKISESAGARFLSSKPSARCPSNFPAEDFNVIHGFIYENPRKYATKPKTTIF